MKLPTMFVHEEDQDPVAMSLRQAQLQFTMIPSVSVLSRKDMVTFLPVLEEEIDGALEVFDEHCEEREVGAPGSVVEGIEVEDFERVEAGNTPVTITTGGATGFTVPVEALYRIGQPENED